MLNNSLLATADALSDRDLLARLEVLARTEREASVELVAQALRLSEDAACNRIEAARACRRSHGSWTCSPRAR